MSESEANGECVSVWVSTIQFWTNKCPARRPDVQMYLPGTPFGYPFLKGHKWAPQPYNLFGKINTKLTPAPVAADCGRLPQALVPLHFQEAALTPRLAAVAAKKGETPPVCRGPVQTCTGF